MEFGASSFFHDDIFCLDRVPVGSTPGKNFRNGYIQDDLGKLHSCNLRFSDQHSWASIWVRDLSNDLLAGFHLGTIGLVIVAFAILPDRYTLVCADGFTCCLLKTGHAEASISGFPLLTLIPEPRPLV
jgi:hypothetical protein